MSPDTAQQVQHAVTVGLTYLFAAFLPFLQRQSQFYWPFLVSTLAVALLVWRFARHEEETGASWREFRRRYLGRALWWHPSARVDYRYYLVNAVVYPLIAAPALVTGAAIASGLDGAFRPILGTPHGLGEAGWAMKLAFTLLFFVAYDFGRFVAHSALHDVPLLWEFHKSHHSAEVLTPFTAFRVHPVDLGVMAWGSAITTGLVTWGFQWLGGPTITFYEFLQMHVLLWGFNLLGNLKHWQVWISYGRVLDRWLISPAHHQLHHSAEARHFGRNRGFEIALWDRLYGTLALPRRGETFRMGLGDGTDGSWHRVWKLYFWPLWSASLRAIGRGEPVAGRAAARR
ncbi:MAG TPA: sterol desaturase family protein [Stellaceae bacterium]|nr:sterol desaturase family protein [Stellaceae bacterium]